MMRAWWSAYADRHCGSRHICTTTGMTSSGCSKLWLPRCSHRSEQSPVHAAVDCQGHARDVAGRVAGQEQHRTGELRGGAVAAHRHFGGHAVERVVERFALAAPDAAGDAPGAGGEAVL